MSDSMNSKERGFDGSEALSDPQIHFCATTNEAKDPCNAQWLMLYTFAAYAPETPNQPTRELLDNFYRHFPDQCTQGPIAQCYANAVREIPPRVNSRRELLLWLCSVENRCRRTIGMATRLCRYDDLMKRWRYPDGYV